MDFFSRGHKSGGSLSPVTSSTYPLKIMPVPNSRFAFKHLAAVTLGLAFVHQSAFAQNAQVVQTSSAGDRMKSLAPLAFGADDGAGLPSVTINPTATKQTIIGFGGAFTEASASVLSKVAKNKRDEVLAAYFGPSGAAYSLCRVHIGSCDFALSSYSYDETAGDTSLSKFSIDHDKQLLIPLIKDAMALSGKNGLQILSSPWTPPSWMTTRGALVARGNHLKKEMYKPYADYLAKYIQAYAKEGIPVSYLTMQNESWNDSGQWETTQFQPQETADFMKVLGPTLASANIQTKVLIYDHNKGLDNSGKNQVKYYVDQTFSKGGGDLKKYVWGFAFHWYGQTQTDPFTDMKVCHEAYPDMHLIHTEACAEGGPHPNDWGVGERYGHDIIGCLNHWTEGWIDWNIVLDSAGGPNHAHNLCSAPILVNTGSGEILYNPSYYYMMHISRFFRPGAVVLDTVSSDPKLEAVACKNPDGSHAVVVENRTESPVDYKINMGGKVIKPTIAAHSIQTFLF